MGTGHKDVIEAMKLYHEALEKGDKELMTLTYENLMRVNRLIDIEEYDKEVYDDFGNLCKKAGEFNNIPRTKEAWAYELPEDRPPS